MPLAFQKTFPPDWLNLSGPLPSGGNHSFLSFVFRIVLAKESSISIYNSLQKAAKMIGSISWTVPLKVLLWWSLCCGFGTQGTESLSNLNFSDKIVWDEISVILRMLATIYAPNRRLLSIKSLTDLDFFITSAYSFIFKSFSRSSLKQVIHLFF